MLFTLVSWALLLGLACLTGAALCRLCGAGGFLDRPEDRFLAQAWTGLLALASLLLWLSVFAPLRPGLCLPLACVMAAALGAAPGVRAELALPPQAMRKPLAVIALVCSLPATGLIMHHDSGLYHFQLIRWLAELGSVPGMALAHYRLSFSSSWLAGTAMLDFGPFQQRTGAILNGLLLVLMVFQFALVLVRLRDGEARRADCFLLCGYPPILVMMLLQRFHVSPSPNLPVAAAILLVVWMLLQSRMDHPEDRNLPLLVSAGAFSLKTTAAPLLLVAGVARLARGTRNRLLLCLAISAVLALPVLVANRVASGCPFFPAALFCSEEPATVGAARAGQVAWETTAWARYRGLVPPVAQLFALDWIPRWLGDPFNAVFVLFATAATAVLLLKRQIGWPALAGWLGALGFLAAAPDMRFGVGYFGALTGLAGSLVPVSWFARVLGRWRWKTWIALAALLLVADAVVREAAYRLYWSEPGAMPRVERLWLPAPVKDTGFSQYDVNGVSYVMPEKELCWALPVPCTPYPPVSTMRYCNPRRGLAGGLCR